MNQAAHNTDLRNSTKSELFYPFFSNGKEKDCESGFHYYGARYYWSEMLTGWLSIDPMLYKYPGISPYNYCAWNPVKMIDPDGNEAVDNDDWYINSRGEMRWFNSTAQTYTYEGEEYTRYGQTARMTNSDGEFVYGDQYGHTHTSMPLKEVSVTEKLTNFERTMRNPLAQKIRQSATKFWGATLDIGFEVGTQTFTYCGLAAQTMGFYSLMAPGGEAIGTELYAIGNAMSNIGLGIDAINNIRKGDWTGVCLDVVSIAVPRGFSKQFNNGISSGFLSATSNDVNNLNSYISTRLGYATEAVNTGRKR